MLRSFLETIRTGEGQSLLAIARGMHISPAMALQMTEELTTKGYLREIGADYVVAQPGCPECPVTDKCQTPVRHWFLTEKGWAYLSTSRSPS